MFIEIRREYLEIKKYHCLIHLRNRENPGSYQYKTSDILQLSYLKGNSND